MKELYELQDNACESLGRLKNKGNLSPADWELAHHITATIKNIDKIMMAKQAGHSQDAHSHGGRWRADIEGNYGPGSSYDDGYSQRRSRDSMGRYSGDGRSMNGYSQHSGSIMSQMEELLRSANDKEREVLMRGISELKSF